MKFFNDENTTGYTTEQLAELNEELAERLVGIEPDSYEWHQIAKQFADEVARRPATEIGEDC